MASCTFEVRGHKVRYRGNRRYVVVAVRPEDYGDWDGVYVAFARIETRSDNIETARRKANRYGWHKGAFCVIYDTAEGKEVL